MYGATDNDQSANNSRAVSLNTQLDDEAPLLAAPVHSDEHFMPVNICWEGVNYTVTGIGGVKRTLLHNVSAYCMPGETLAIMGPSGSGKTTLLNIVAKRRMKSKDLEGDIMVNGHKVTKPTKKIFKRISGYVMQEDFLIGTLTVKETLVNAALLRLPKNMTYEDKMKRVDRALEVLGLRHIQDNRIGTQMARGVSGGERRRVSIAVELISSPPIMFLDEPTSGLDSKNSQSVCDTLIELKRRRHTVIFTIHQPRSHIFAEFDKLLLLARGKVMYFGAASNALAYFSRLGQQVSLQENPADFLVDLVTIDLRDQVEVQKLEDFSNHYNQCQEFTATKEKIVELSSVSGGKRDSMRPQSKRGSFIEHLKEEEALITEFREATGAPHADEKPNPLTQFKVLLKRNFITVTRDRSRLFGRVVVSIFQGVMVGTTFFQLSDNEDQVIDRVNDLFFVCTFFFLLSYTILPRIIADRLLFLRERSNGMYGTWPYFLASTLASLPLCFLPSFAYSGLVAFLSDLQTSADRFFFWIFLTFLHAFCGESLIQFCSCISRSYDIAYAIVGAIFQVFLFFGGFAVTYSNILSMWKWAYWVSCYQYAFSGVMINEFEGREFDCGDKPPSECYFTDGETVLDYYDLDDRSKWACLWIVVAMICGYRFLAYLALRFIVKERV